jgi:hypothetical protein
MVHYHIGNVWIPNWRRIWWTVIRIEGSIDWILRLHEMPRPHAHACDAESVLSVAVYTHLYGEINQDHQGIIDETLFCASPIDQNAVHPTVLIPLPPCFTCISITDFYNSPSAVSVHMDIAST